MNEKWFKDIMIQKYPADIYCDPTKLFLILSFVKDNSILEKVSIFEVCESVYRYYLFNKQVRINNINPVIRNIEKYGIEDIENHIKLSIMQFIKEQKYDSIAFDSNYVYSFMDNRDEKSTQLTIKMIHMLFEKYYKIKLENIPSLEFIKYMDDSNKNIFGNSLLKQFVLEDIQYCPLSEETDVNKLFVAHIIKSNETEDLNILTDKNNAILLESQLWEDYVNNKFYINEFGKVINICSTLVNNKMRLPMKFLNKRKKYFKIKEELLNK